ncbi:hypothetical protein [Granulicella sibirica]|uniref:Uncharacterized protein n=1 Tax=Granulicella sibirica TaxID=2479048 RepID=A0A4V1L5W0_9BACT|nr:hypothetical protein [Granulicella sibirica]RXH57134.1 hypothetical protein GRAN_0444 [Granulicella sibirica]
MNPDSKPHIASAEPLDGGVIIAFDDGRIGLYSAELLSRVFLEAKELFDKDVDGIEA